MKILTKINMFIFGILCLILIGGFFLRFNRFHAIPFPGESMDEYSNAWVGLSLIQNGVPIGFSGIKGYDSYDYRYINVDNVFAETANGNPIVLNSPWFDHPPFLGMLVGGYSYLSGARVFEDARVRIIRQPMVVLGVISIFLVFLFGYLIYGLKTGLIASAIYATSPITVISSRMVQAENALIPLFLISLITLFLYFKTNKKIFFWVSALASGGCLLIKISGVVSLISALGLLAYVSLPNKKKLLFETGLYAFVSLSFLLFYFVYGFVFDINTFFNVLAGNSQRVYGLGVSLLYNLVTEEKITNTRFLTDGWYLSGWCSFIALLLYPFTDKLKKMFLVIPVLSYLLIYVFFGSESFGWYRFPFLPFLSIAIALIVSLVINRKINLFLGIFVLVIPIGVMISKIYNYESLLSLSSIFRFSLSGLLLLALISIFGKGKRLMIINIIVILCVFLVALYLNTAYLNMITVEYWRKIT